MHQYKDYIKKKQKLIKIILQVKREFLPFEISVQNMSGLINWV